MSTTARLLLVAVVASVMAILGMELISLRNGSHVDFHTLKIVVPLSIFVWMVLSLFVRGRPVLIGIYVGFLSPFLGGVLALPPFGLVIVLSNLAICIGIGLATGLLIAVALRLGGER